MIDCVTAYNLQTITVLPDSAGIAALMNVVQKPGNEANSNPLGQLLASGNQNTVGQILTSLSQVFNKLSNASMQSAVASEYNFVTANFDILLLK
jgi:hypothetical protein